MKILKLLGTLVMVAAVAAGCGGGNTLTGNSSKGPSGTPAAVTVTSATPSITSDGKVTSVITATVVDSHNVAVTNATVSFSASGGALESVTATTDATGTATATLTANGVSVGKVITVKATSGSASGSTTVSVVGSAGGPSSTPAAVHISSSASAILANGNSTATITATVVDANNVAVSNAQVVFASSSGALQNVIATTGAAGTATATLTANGTSAGTPITVTAAVGSLAPASTQVQVVTTIPTGNSGGGAIVTPAAIYVSSSSTSISTDGTVTALITATAVDQNNVVIPNVTLSFAASAGGLLQNVNPTTGNSGTATATVAANGASVGAQIVVTASFGSFSGSTTVNVVKLTNIVVLSTSSPQIPSSGSSGATLTAVVLDQNNNAVNGATVTFAATSGVVTGSPAKTNSAGVATASLTAGLSPADRRITVTAITSGGSAQVPVDVVGTTLSITGLNQLSYQSSANYTVTLTNSSGAPIANTAIALASANGNSLSSTSVTTNNSGQAAFTVTGTSTANNGADTITATALGATVNQALTVSLQTFTVTVPTDPAAINSVQTVTATLLSAGTPVSGQTVSFSATRGQLSAPTAVTDDQGVATVTISSTSAGASLVTATGTVNGSNVAAQATINFVATAPTQVAVQASPASIPVNGQSTITATLRDSNNNLVAGQAVNFTLNDVTGGVLSTSTATTNAQGVAQVIYTASTTTSAANGVVVTATVQGNSAVSASTTLTVGGQTVFLSLGTGNTVQSPTQATYSIQYAVLAIDAQGGPVANAPITLQVLPYAYLKGGRVWNVATGSWTTVSSVAPSAGTPNPDFPLGTNNLNPFCANEDTDFTGNLFSLGTTVINNVTYGVKDYNLDGILEPGNVASVSPNTVTTDASGQVLVTVSYPKDHAGYVGVTLVATTTVQGTQSSTSTTFVLPAAAADFSTQSTPPPGINSPYGSATSCASPN